MSEMRNLLTQAINEVSRLRRANEILGAKVEMIDLFACVLHTTAAQHSQGMGEDIVWKMQKAVDAEDALANRPESA